MKIFLSHSSGRGDVAEEISLALESEGHDVFFDRHDLPTGRGYNARIRDEIARADLFVFLVDRDSVARGRYTRTELKLARKRWPSAAGRVLPVRIDDVPFDQIPPYLRSVTLFEPVGDVAADVSAAVAELAATRTLATPVSKPSPAGDWRSADRRRDGRGRRPGIGSLVARAAIVGGALVLAAFLLKSCFGTKVERTISPDDPGEGGAFHGKVVVGSLEIGL